jgi:subtilisin family serine protease
VRRLIVGAVVLLAATALAPAGISLAAPSSAGSPSPAEPASVPGELLVGYRHGVSETHRSEARARAHARWVDNVVDESAERDAVELVSVSGIDRAEATRRFKSDPNVAFAEPNWVYTHDVVPPASDDPYYTNGSLWGMYGDLSSPANQYGSQAAEAWAAGNTGSSSVYVGIIDEGYQYTHPDFTDSLGSNVGTNPGETGYTVDGVDKATDGVDNDGNGYKDDVYGWDFDGGNNSVYDAPADNHGTHVAGTIGARGNNGIGVAGVNWNVKLISAKFLGVQGGTTANAVKAVDYLTDLKTRDYINLVATNNSWGGGGYSQALYDAIQRANVANIMFIAAAGNDGRNTDTRPSYPAAYNLPNVISVAAIDKDGLKASWSNYGASSVDLGAPGVDIWSTLPTDSYGSYSGTSMATPHVTGAVALYAASHAGAAVAGIRSTLLGTVVPTSALNGKTVTGGRLDVNKFVTALPAVKVTKAKSRGATLVTVTWSGFTKATVDLYRNGAMIASGTANDGIFTESLSVPGTVIYQVCEAGTSTCAQGSIVI